MGKAADDHARISSLAEELGLEGEERDDFISSAMTRLKHVAKTVWDDAPAEGSVREGDFFSRSRSGSGGNGGGSSRETRRVGGDREYRG